MRAVPVRWSFVLAPVLTLVGLLAMKLGWKLHPDLDWDVALPLWTGAHLVSIAGYLAYGAVLAALWAAARAGTRRAGWRHVVDGVGLLGSVGVVAIVGQMAIDLVVGFEAGQRSAMHGLTESVQSVPGFGVFFYGLVPDLQFAATGVLMVVLAARRVVPVWAATVFAVAIGCLATGSTAAMLIGAAATCVALWPISRYRTLTPRRGGRVTYPDGSAPSPATTEPRQPTSDSINARQDSR